MAERTEGEPYVPDVSPDLPSLRWRTVLALLDRLPQAALSRTLGSLADIRLPYPLRRPVLGTFVRLVGIDVSEAERSLTEYTSVNDIFVRRLTPGARTWPDDPDALASPVDGIVGRHGTIRRGRLIQAKGRDYSAADLLADPDAAGRYEGGTFVTLYLSPRHYHRIHSPCGGLITAAVHVPGALLPVNQPGVQHLPDLFPRSERIICSIDIPGSGATAPATRVTVVAVGAYNVGRISTTFDPEWAGPGVSVSNRRGAMRASRSYDPPVPVQQGDEIMAFHLGSTVVMLCEPGWDLLAPDPGTDVRMGSILLRRAPR